MNKKPMYTYRVTEEDVLIFNRDGNPVEIENYS